MCGFRIRNSQNCVHEHFLIILFFFLTLKKRDEQIKAATEALKRTQITPTAFLDRLTFHESKVCDGDFADFDYNIPDDWMEVNEEDFEENSITLGNIFQCFHFSHYCCIDSLLLSIFSLLYILFRFVLISYISISKRKLCNQLMMTTLYALPAIQTCEALYHYRANIYTSVLNVGTNGQRQIQEHSTT